MGYSDRYDSDLIQHYSDKISTITTTEIQCAILYTYGHDVTDILNRMAALICPVDDALLEDIAVAAHRQTIQRFGRTIQVFIPMYLSNACYNQCTYCGFSRELNYARVVLSASEVVAQAQLLAQRGYSHILLVTGEAPDLAGLDYLCQMVSVVRPFFSHIGIEVQPFESDAYQRLIDAGVDSLTVYQETYDATVYAAHHLSGKKRNFRRRLDVADHGGTAGFAHLTVGALMGLGNWQWEALSLAHHLFYLKKRYWKTKFSVSFPRIQNEIGGYQAVAPVSDRALTQLILAFRLCFPDLGITLSTRESAEFRNALVPLGVTTMSCESHTAPGGYLGKATEAQFDISDFRSLSEFSSDLRHMDRDVVMKDWDSVLQ